MKAFWNKYKKLLIGLAAALSLAGGWLLLWHRVGTQVEHAAYRSAFESLVYDGAYYKECTLETVQDYVPEAKAVGEALCGTALGSLQFPSESGTVTCPLYACKALEDAGKEKAIVLLKKEEEYLAYELSGFQYLDGEPSVWAVCASYGIGKAADIESLTLADADGNVQETITDADAVSDFYDKFIKLGECLTDEELSQAYLDAYIAEFGDDGKMQIQNGKLEATDQEAFDAAAAYWHRDVLSVTIRLRNGLMMRDCLYAPTPGIFAVYGNYKLTEPFFELKKT